MEETLTDCLVRVREDLRQLKRVRDYLDTNAETEERCSVTWRTIEAFNSILSVCSSQNTPETNALDTLLDSFYYLARNNKNDSVWIDFGFELGIICVKVLSAIERTDVFEILFCKLLSVISIISEHNSNIWKAAARQILNVLINKKVSLSYLEAILKLYISILKNIESSALYDFSSQNLHLLKTLSLLVQRTGDFEIQSDVIELIFFHLSNETKLMSGFFSSLEGMLFRSLDFTDFENDCRLYLNALNKPRKGFERKVYSICCHVLYLGGCFVEPPVGRNYIWVDANTDSERVSIKCADIESSANRVIYIQFSEIINVQLENNKTDGNRCLTIQTKTLLGVQKDVKNDDLCLVVENKTEVTDFVNFLQSTIAGRKKMKKFGGKGSKTIDCLVINRSDQRREVQDNAITSSERPGTDNILPDVSSLFERTNQITETKPKQASEGVPKTPSKTTRIVLESQELSPNSFVESLNKHIGSGSPELRHTFEDSIETIEFLQKNTSRTHKLFRSPDKVFPHSDKNESNFNFFFGENKENDPPVEVKTNIKTYSRKPREEPVEPVEKPSTFTFVLKDQKNIEVKLTNTESQDYFHRGSNVLKKKKPRLPKLRRNTKPSKTAEQLKPQVENKNTSNDKIVLQTKEREGIRNRNKLKLQTFQRQINKLEKQKTIKTPVLVLQAETKEQYKVKENVAVSKVGNTLNQNFDSLCQKNQNKAELIKQTRGEQGEKPSLLDPNGYAYQRWCQPTTSERSNFWLKKLSDSQKPKTDPDSVFDFSDDSVVGRIKRKKKVVRSNPKLRSRTKQTTLRQVKEILKKSPMKAKPRDLPEIPKEVISFAQNEPTAESPHSPTEVIFNPPQKEWRCSFESSNGIVADKDSEYESVSEDEEPPVATKKRERSDEDTSLSRRRGKKKQKTTIPKYLLQNLRQRLRNVEESNKRRTDDIIQTINKATDHLFDHLRRKSAQTLISYLKTAEEASAAFSAEEDELSMRGKRIQRAVLYFKAGCSISDSQETLESQFSKIRSKFKDLREKRDTSKMVDRISKKLSSVINSDIERLLKDEWESKRSKLVRCASIFQIDLGNLKGILEI